MELLDAYKSLIEALNNAGLKTRTKVNMTYVDSEDIERDGTDALEGVDGIVVPGGFGERGVEGKISAVRYARGKSRSPIWESAWACRWPSLNMPATSLACPGAHSTEFRKDSQYPVVGLITEWVNESGEIEERAEDSDLAAPCAWAPRTAGWVADSTAYHCYGGELIRERHRHRYEVNNNLLPRLKEAGLRVAGSPVTADWWKSWKCRITLVRGLPVPPGIHVNAP